MTQAKNRQEYIGENVNDVLSRIKSSANRAGRDPGAVRLLAATKHRSLPEIREAVAAGVSILGENRVQELIEKAPHVGDGPELHFIGHLQRNKVRQVVGVAQLIHSLDSLRLAEEIDLRARACGIVQDALVQVNVAMEESKSGIEAGKLAAFLRSVIDLKNVRVGGLSTIAPYSGKPEDIRWVFSSLRELGEECQQQVEGFDCVELSMGMTNDFEIAVEEGSTIVRVGTAIFGPRSY
ncbi:MAG: YggS family pyridoxal phosphate-dependent enzyme [Candidatus Geothermincolia bacterium]